MGHGDSTGGVGEEESCVKVLGSFWDYQVPHLVSLFRGRGGRVTNGAGVLLPQPQQVAGYPIPAVLDKHMNILEGENRCPIEARHQ